MLIIIWEQVNSISETSQPLEYSLHDFSVGGLDVPDDVAQYRFHRMISFPSLENSTQLEEIEPTLEDMVFRASRILLTHILQGERSPPTSRALQFQESVFIRKKYIPILINPYPDILPVFQYNQLFLSINDSLPTLKDIYDFILPLFEVGKLQAESLVVMLMFIERLTEDGQTELRIINWRPISIIATLLASKMLEDSGAGNLDLAYVHRSYSLNSINLLERTFLDMISWRLFIDLELYKKYYFALRQVDLHDLGRDSFEELI